MGWLNRFLRYLIGDRVIHAAVSKGDVASVAQWLRRGFDVNGYDNLGYTPLQTSLLFQQHHCTIFLLTHGADPNLLCYSCLENRQGSTVQPYLKILLQPSDDRYKAATQDYESIIRLLTLYGLESVDFTSPLPFPYSRPESFRQIYEATQQQKKTIAKLQNMIEGHIPLVAYEAAVEMQQLSQKIMDDEKNPTFKSYYQEKVEYYRKKADTLRTKVPEETKSTARPKPLAEVIDHNYSSLLTSHKTHHQAKNNAAEEEKTPLLSRVLSY